MGGVLLDGSFSGSYSDFDAMLPTIRYCNFSEQFSEPEQVDEYTHSMTMESITLENMPGEESYRSETHYIASTPYVLEEANEVLLYLPGKKVSELPESFLDWSYGSISWETKILPFYGLYMYNVEEEYGFVTVGYYSNLLN